MIKYDKNFTRVLKRKKGVREGKLSLMLGCFLASAVGAGSATFGTMTWMNERAVPVGAELLRLEEEFARSWEEVGVIRRQLHEQRAEGAAVEPSPAVERRRTEEEDRSLEEAVQRAVEAANQGLDRTL